MFDNDANDEKAKKMERKELGKAGEVVMVGGEVHFATSESR